MKTFSIALMSMSFPLMLIGVWLHFADGYEKLILAPLAFGVSIFLFFAAEYLKD